MNDANDPLLQVMLECTPVCLEWTQVSRIDANIFLGGIPEPQDDIGDYINYSPLTNPNIILHEYGITTLISITNKSVSWKIPDHVTYLHICIPDIPDAPISILFDKVRATIRVAVEKGSKVFIHCHAGISRSVTLLCAYYMYYGIPDIIRPTVRDVLRYVAVARPFICPNMGFLSQLLDYEKRLVNERKHIDQLVVKDSK